MALAVVGLLAGPALASQCPLLIKQVMEESFVRWCPGVRPQADVDIATSLSDDDVIDEEQLARIIELTA